jgi:hypothetical protein
MKHHHVTCKPWHIHQLNVGKDATLCHVPLGPKETCYGLKHPLESQWVGVFVHFFWSSAVLQTIFKASLDDNMVHS